MDIPSLCQFCQNKDQQINACSLKETQKSDHAETCALNGLTEQQQQEEEEEEEEERPEKELSHIQTIKGDKRILPRPLYEQA